VFCLGLRLAADMVSCQPCPLFDALEAVEILPERPSSRLPPATESGAFTFRAEQSGAAPLRA
jgi:hypothetical protein